MVGFILRKHLHLIYENLTFDLECLFPRIILTRNAEIFKLTKYSLLQCFIAYVYLHTFNFVILETDGVPGQHFRPPLPVGPRPPQPQQQNFQQQQHQQLQQQQQQQQMENRTQMLLQQRQQMPGAIPNPARVEVSLIIL